MEKNLTVLFVEGRGFLSIRYKLEKTFEYTTSFLNNVADIWQKADLDLKQRLQGLITPFGFTVEGKLIEPVKKPHFITIFGIKKGFNQNNYPRRELNSQPSP